MNEGIFDIHFIDVYLTSVLFWIHPRLDFGLGGFPFLFGLKNQILFIWEVSFENLLNSPMAFGGIFSPFQKSLLP